MRRIGALGALGLMLGAVGCAGGNRRVASIPAGPGGTIPGTSATAARPARLETNRWARAQRPTWPASDRPAAATNRPPDGLARFFPGLSRDVEEPRPTLVAGGGHDHRLAGPTLVEGPRGLPVDSRDLPPALPVTLSVKVEPAPAVRAATAVEAVTPPEEAVAATAERRDGDARRVRIEEEARPRSAAAPDPMPAAPTAEVSAPSAAAPDPILAVPIAESSAPLAAAPGPALVSTANLPTPELPSPKLPEIGAPDSTDPATPEVAQLAESSVELPPPAEPIVVPAEPPPAEEPTPNPADPVALPDEPPPAEEPTPNPAGPFALPDEPPPADEPSARPAEPIVVPAESASEVGAVPKPAEPTPADDLPEEPPSVGTSEAPDPDETPVEPVTTATDAVLAGRPRLKSYPTVNATPAPGSAPASSKSRPARAGGDTALPPVQFPSTYYPSAPAARSHRPRVSASTPAKPRRSIIGRLRDRWHARGVEEVEGSSAEVGVGIAPRGE